LQVIVGQGDGWVRSFDGMTGKLLWKFDVNPKAAVWKAGGGRGTRNYIPATPVYHDGRVYVASGRDPLDGPGVGHLWCIDAMKTPKNEDKDLSPVGDNFDPGAAVNNDSGLVWHQGGPIVPVPKDGPEWHFGRTLSSVAIQDGLVIAPEHDGYIHCFDARTGKRHWRYDARTSIVASPLIADGKVYVPTEEGVVVLALSSEMKLLASNDVDSQVLSSVVFANGVLYLATPKKLFAIKE
jgi:outer membrane protein assembly factor BamB